MFRSELIHPISVHFPIVLVTLILVFKLAYFFIKDEVFKKNIHQLYFVFLVGSIVATFISIYLGDMAFDLIRSNLCKLGPVDSHEDFSKLLALTLFLIMLFETIFIVIKEKIKDVIWFKAKELTVLILLIFVAINLFQTAHSGAMLVYELGAGVLNHPKNCQ